MAQNSSPGRKYAINWLGLLWIKREWWVGEKVAREREGTASERVPFANDDGGTEREETRATSPVRTKTRWNLKFERRLSLAYNYSSPDRITNHVCAACLHFQSKIHENKILCLTETTWWTSTAFSVFASTKKYRGFGIKSGSIFKSLSWLVNVNHLKRPSDNSHFEEPCPQQRRKMISTGFLPISRLRITILWSRQILKTLGSRQWRGSGRCYRSSTDLFAITDPHLV